MDQYDIVVPEESRVLAVMEEDFVIQVPGEWRWIEVQADGPSGE